MRGLGAMLLILRGGGSIRQRCPARRVTVVTEKSARDVPLGAHDEVDLGLGRDVEVAVGLGLPPQADLLALLLVVLVDVLLGALEDHLALSLAGLWSERGREDKPRTSQRRAPHFALTLACLPHGLRPSTLPHRARACAGGVEVARGARARKNTRGRGSFPKDGMVVKSDRIDARRLKQAPQQFGYM